MKITVPKGSYVVAVSGGIDSVVLLDLVMKSDVTVAAVAHFDHGTRDDSADDERFVGQLAHKYDVPYISRREELGMGVSEERARARRYVFLREVAKEHGARIMTAHHADDVIETIAINLIRGTGWRGLAVLDSPDVVRPLLGFYKAELAKYANENGLSWHEDSTNSDDLYLRNRLRSRVQSLDQDVKQQLLALHAHQVTMKAMIDEEVRLYDSQPCSRYFFTMVPEVAAEELIRALCSRVAGYTPLTNQKQRAVQAIKTALPGTRHDIGGGVFIEFTRTHFIVKTSGK